MRREVGRKLAIAGGAIVVCAVPLFVWGLWCSGAPMDLDMATNDYAIEAMVLASLAGTVGIILCAIGLLSPPANRPRLDGDVHCKRCGHELVAPGGPCRKCDDVKTKLCCTCGNHTPVNRKACMHCGADLK
jgi:hypothetical protein